eukprot:scaffold144682_cov32-Attheya_sp.AAC.1
MDVVQEEAEEMVEVRGRGGRGYSGRGGGRFNNNYYGPGRGTPRSRAQLSNGVDITDLTLISADKLEEEPTKLPETGGQNGMNFGSGAYSASTATTSTKRAKR